MLPPSVANAVRTLAIDRVTGEVVAAFDGAGLHPILLKGPSITMWLYGDGRNRSYGDTDLLVPPGEVAAAEDVLARLGFHPPLRFEDGPHGWKPDGLPWVRRADGATVDLHREFPGARVDAATAWDAVFLTATTMQVGGIAVRILDEPARALMLGLHAARHGASEPKPLEDLERGLALVPKSSWLEAVRLAHVLGAEARLGAGLRLLERGVRLADELDLPKTCDAEYVIRSGESSTVSLGLVRIGETPGVRGKLLAAITWAVPSRAYMRYTTSLARRGRAGLTLAYLLRLARGPRVAAAWLRAARLSGP